MRRIIVFEIDCLEFKCLETKIYPPWRDHPWSPMGSQFDSLSVLYLPLRKVFWISIYTMYLLIFDPWNFLSPVAGPSLVVPYGVPI